MRIGHYCSELWSKGGVETYLRRIGEAQRAAGHTVYYFSNRSYGDAANLAEPLITVKNGMELLEEAQHRNLEILHFHTTFDQLPSSTLPTIRTVHGHHAYCPSGGKFFKRWNHACDRSYSVPGCLWGKFVDQCGSIRPENIEGDFRHTQHEIKTLLTMPTLTVSQFLKDEMMRSGYAVDSIRVLHLFAPEPSPRLSVSPSAVPHFVFLGRITPEKGLNWLLKALQRVNVPIHLDIAGEGPQEPEMKQLVQELKISDRVTFHGWLSTTQTSQLIQSARAVIFPSLWPEPAGFISLEAAAHSRAVIASRIGGIPEYAAALENAILIEPGNGTELSNAIIKLTTDEALANHLGNAGKVNIVKHFQLEKHFCDLMEIYTEVIQNTRTSHTKILI